MKFKSDKHRKAVFANMFNSGGSKGQSKVSSINVTNFEVKTTRMKQVKLPKFKVEPVRLKDIKVKGERLSCEACKRKGLSLKKGKCKDCRKEIKNFKQPKNDLIVSFADETDVLDEVLEAYYNRYFGDENLEELINDINRSIKGEKEWNDDEISTVVEAMWKWDDEGNDTATQIMVDSIYNKIGEVQNALFGDFR